MDPEACNTRASIFPWTHPLKLRRLQDPVEAVKRWKIDTGFDYEVRGEITTMRLDALIEHDVQVSRRASCPRAVGLHLRRARGNTPRLFSLLHPPPHARLSLYRS